MKNIYHESMDFINIYLRKIQKNDDYMNDYSGDGKYSNFNTEKLVVICLDLFPAGSEYCIKAVLIEAAIVLIVQIEAVIKYYSFFGSYVSCDI